MDKTAKVGLASLVTLVLTGGGFAVGQSINNVTSDQVIYACVTGINGNITKVSNTPKVCPKGSTPISWNMVGPKGDVGDKGSKGEQGAQGLPGSDALTVGAKLTSPNGLQVLRIVSFNGLNVVSLNDKYWSIDANGVLGPVGTVTDSTQQLFQSSDCSGPAYISQLGTETSGIGDNFVFGTTKNGMKPNGLLYTAHKVDVSLSDIHSIRNVDSTGQSSPCILASNLEKLSSDMSKQKVYAAGLDLPKYFTWAVTGSRYYYRDPIYTADTMCNVTAVLVPISSQFGNTTYNFHNPDCENIDRYGWGDFLQFGTTEADFNKITSLSWGDESELLEIANRWEKLYQITPVSRPEPLTDWTWGIDSY